MSGYQAVWTKAKRDQFRHLSGLGYCPDTIARTMGLTRRAILMHMSGAARKPVSEDYSTIQNTYAELAGFEPPKEYSELGEVTYGKRMVAIQRRLLARRIAENAMSFKRKNERAFRARMEVAQLTAFAPGLGYPEVQEGHVLPSRWSPALQSSFIGSSANMCAELV